MYSVKSNRLVHCRRPPQKNKRVKYGCLSKLNKTHHIILNYVNNIKISKYSFVSTNFSSLILLPKILTLNCPKSLIKIVLSWFHIKFLILSSSYIRCYGHNYIIKCLDIHFIHLTVSLVNFDETKIS